MKITAINMIKINLPTDEWLLLRLETDKGLCGWGEITGDHDEGITSIIQKISEKIIGKNPLNIAECTQFFYDWVYPVRNNIRGYATALSGLDQCLWDVSAKYYKIPLYKMLGGDGKSKIPLYANMNKALRKDRSPEALYENTKKALNAGFNIIKCTPFDEVTPFNVNNSLEKGFERFASVIDIIPIEQIAFDCHQRFERHTLSRMLERLCSDYGYPYWVEDPVPVLDYETMRYAIQAFPQIRWAAGEDSFIYSQINTTMESRCYEILMPDIKYIGGVSVIRSIIPFAEGLGFKVSIHNPNGIIATAHSAHVSSLSRSNIPMEIAFTSAIDRSVLSTPHEVVKDGYYHFSEEPGIGVEISEQAMQDFGLIYFNEKWEAYKK